MSKPIVGVQLFTLREYCKSLEDFQKTIKKVADMGYPCVQISGVANVSDEDVIKVVEDNGLTIGSTHVGWNQFTDDTDALITKHELWKCKHPAIGGIHGAKAGPEGIREFIKELAPVAEKLKAAGMDFSYHNHSHEFVKYDGKSIMDILFEETSADQLNFEIDTYWVQHGGSDPAMWIEKCKGRIPVVHYKDMSITADREQRFAPVGEGNLNWERIVQATLDVGAEYIFIEQDQCYDQDPFDALAASFRNLQKWGLV
ncbi:MAG: sugar phosphate isomerase/epimerase family protein [Candidatus Sumerlaeia bacterium]